jgi:hypothetical protein
MNMTISKLKIEDYMLLSKHRTLTTIKYLLPHFKVRCNLSDRNGKINILINETYLDQHIYQINLINNSNILLDDRYLYNIIFNYKKHEYSLQEHDEYYEKIKV